MKKKVKWAIAGMLLLALVVYGVAQALRPLQVETLLIKPQTIAKSFTEEGLVVPALEKTIHTEAGGKVAKVTVAEGDLVPQGKLLAEMDTTALDFQLASLRGQLLSIEGQRLQSLRPASETQLVQQRLALEQAVVQLAAARAEFERVAVLYQAGAVSKGNYEAAEKAVRQMELLAAQQEKALELLQEQGQPTAGVKEHFSGLINSLAAQIALLEHQKAQGKIIAPMDGIVRDVHIKVGSVLAPGMPVITLFDAKELQVEVFLLPADVLQVEPGLRVRLIQESPFGDKNFAGTVAKIAPGATERISPLGLIEQRVKVDIKLEGDVKEIRPGYNLEAEFVTHQEEGRLVVPKTVLFPYQGQDALWLIREGRAAIQPVTTGLSADEEIVITEGLNPGDRVIKNPRLEGLKPGRSVVGSQ